MEITVYGTRSGAFCNAARQLLDNHGITFVSVLMDNDGTLRSSVRKNSQRDTCPQIWLGKEHICLLYTSPSPRDSDSSRMPSSA